MELEGSLPCLEQPGTGPYPVKREKLYLQKTANLNRDADGITQRIVAKLSRYSWPLQACTLFCMLATLHVLFSESKVITVFGSMVLKSTF
jgi:hypothetical protein